MRVWGGKDGTRRKGTPQPGAPGYVYFLRSLDRTRCKVGFSYNPYRRWQHLRIQGRDFEFLGYIPGTPELEAGFSREFRKSSTPLLGPCGGPTLDWFSYTPEIRRIIEGLLLFSSEEARKLDHELSARYAPKPGQRMPQAAGKRKAGG